MKRRIINNLKTLFIFNMLISTIFSFAQTDDFSGTALYFDGSSHYVDIPNDSSINLTNNFTIEAWIKPEAFHWLGGIVSKSQSYDSDGYTLRHVGSSPYRGIEFNGWMTANNILHGDQWCHIAAVFKWDSPHIYINGVEYPYSGNGNNIYQTNDPLTIGVDFLHSPRYFKGLIDEVVIWNVHRTEQEIRENMYLPFSGNETGLVSYWQFNNAFGTVAADHVGPNNGTLKNMDDVDWKLSSIPFGYGHSNTQTVLSTGNVSFPETGLSMDFTSKTGSDDIVVAKIENAPDTIPNNCDEAFVEQYWVINQYGTGSFTANVTFTIEEDLTAEDEATPSRISLYKRDACSGPNWGRAFSATSVNAATNTATFNGLEEFEQFIIGRRIETEAPYAISTYPGQGGMLLSLNELKINFNEIVNQVAGKSISIYRASGIPVLTYYIPNSDIAGSGSTSITINLDTILTPDSYYVVVDEGALRDLSLNNFSGYQGSEAWTFTIRDSEYITNDTTWSGDVFVYMDLTVKDSVTLSISPGSNIEFGGHYKLNIQGRLLANGTENDSIHFFPSTGQKWNRIVFNNTPPTNDSSKISYCILENSKANSGGGGNDGGAIYIYNVDKLLIENSRISHNHADYYGGGIFCKNANPVIQNTIFSHNWGQIDGGGISLFNSNPVIVNNLFIYNNGNNSGGGMSFYGGSNPHVFNTTFSENHIGNSGGAVAFDHGSSPVFTNCIFYNNHSTYGAKEVDISSIGTNEPDFYYCIVQGGTAGFYGAFNGEYENSMDTNPLFKHNGAYPFSLQKASPAINEGDPASSTIDVGSRDIAGNPRFKHGQIDMGAYEISMIPDDFAGTAVSFDGIDDWIDCGNDTSLNIANNITVEAWIKVDPVTHNNAILQKGGLHWLSWDFSLESISGKGIQINLPGPNTGWWEFEYDMEYGKWYHVAWTFSYEGELKAYVNGEITRQAMFPGSMQINTDHLKMAVAENANPYKGLLDEIRVWNVVRTSQEIRENMYLTFPENKTGLVSYWQFNYGEGIVITDINGCNRGKMHNMTDDNWVNSTLPFGSGNSNSQVISSMGIRLFPNTGIEMDFLSKTGIDIITVSRIDTIANSIPQSGEKTLEDQYWVINQFGTGTFNANLNFTVSEELSTYDELNPSNILLFNRENTSDTSWTLIGRASSVNTQDNTATFDSISDFGQFILSKNEFDYYPGNALQFNTNGGYMELANENQFDFDTAFTIETWLYLDSMSENYHTILSKGDAWQLRLLYSVDTIILEFSINMGSQSLAVITGSDTASMLRKWNHISCAYDWTDPDKYFCMYLNGIKSDSLKAAVLTTNNEPVRTGNSFRGRFDELRFWNTKRSAQQIRENMHLTLPYSFTGLISYLQANEGHGTKAQDIFGGNYGIFFNNPDTAAWANSSVPFGGGNSNTQIESQGIIEFPDTDLSMDFSSQSGASVTISKIDTTPNINPSGVTDIFNLQYWVVDRYGNGSFNADLTFAVAEELTVDDGNNPGQIKLYNRPPNSSKQWTLIDSASNISLSLSNSQITFNDITTSGQFIIGRKKPFSGYPGYALHFDGVDDNIFGSGIDTNMSAFTIESWIKHDAFPAKVQRYISIEPELAVLRYDGTIYGGYRELHFYIKKPNGHLYGIRVDSVLEVDEWMHVAGTYDGASMKLYLNGNILGVENMSAGLYSPDGNFEFSSSGEAMNGEMDEIRIWDYARTEGQIREGMHRVINMSEKGLFNYWQFNEAGGTIVVDTVKGLQSNLYNMDVASCWTESTIPAGMGVSNTQLVDAIGNFDFEPTNVTMDFTSQTESDSIVVTKINISPNITPPLAYQSFDSQYWAVNNFGANDFTTDITFEPNENLTTFDEIYPYSIKLFSRNSNSDSAWVLIDSAHSVNATQNTIIFEGINHFSQFLIARGENNMNPPGNCLYFDGVDDYVSIPINTSLNNNEFTVEFWISTDNPPQWTGIIDKGRHTHTDWYFLTGSSGQTEGVKFGIGKGSDPVVEISHSWNDNNWHHVAGTYDGSTMNLYVDGNHKGSRSVIMVNSNNGIHFGNRLSESWYFTGKLDEIRIWNIAHNQEQIRDVIHKTLSGTEENLVSYWLFDELSGNVAHDLGSGNNGSLNNMTNSSWRHSTAPVPYFTITDGGWELPGTWADGQNAPVHPWSRAMLKHNITLNSNMELIELKIDTNAVLTISSGNTFTVSGSE